MFSTALLLGLGSSLHCIGMCGPLAMALPLAVNDRLAMIRGLLIYHFGRLLTYSGLGLLFGIVGKGLVLAGWQQAISVMLGVALVTTALLTFFAQNNRSFFIPDLFFTQKIKLWLGQAIRQRGIIVAGILNGLLPCGMVYFALAGAVSATSGWNSALYMAIFGLGTLPALMLAGLVNAPVRQYIRWAQPVLMAIAGLLLINRGLSVDLSFWESAVPKAGFDCH